MTDLTNQIGAILTKVKNYGLSQSPEGGNLEPFDCMTVEEAQAKLEILLLEAQISILYRLLPHSKDGTPIPHHLVALMGGESYEAAKLINQLQQQLKENQ
jgi:hypothetical protein